MSMPLSSERETVATSLGEKTREEVLEARCEKETRLGGEVGGGGWENADDHAEHVAELIGVVVSGVRGKRDVYPSKRIGNEVNMWDRFASSWTNSTCRQT